MIHIINENDKLKQDNKQLNNENNKLKQDNDKITNENKQLKQQNKRYLDKIFILEHPTYYKHYKQLPKFIPFQDDINE